MRCPTTLTTRTTVGSEADETPSPYMYLRVAMSGYEMCRRTPGGILTWWRQHGIRFRRDSMGQWAPCRPYRIWRDPASDHTIIEQTRYTSDEEVSRHVREQGAMQ